MKFKPYPKNYIGKSSTDKNWLINNQTGLFVNRLTGFSTRVKERYGHSQLNYSWLDMPLSAPQKSVYFHPSEQKIIDYSLRSMPCINLSLNTLKTSLDNNFFPTFQYISHKHLTANSYSSLVLGVPKKVNKNIIQTTIIHQTTSTQITELANRILNREKRIEQPTSIKKIMRAGVVYETIPTMVVHHAVTLQSEMINKKMIRDARISNDLSMRPFQQQTNFQATSPKQPDSRQLAEDVIQIIERRMTAARERMQRG